MGSALEALLWLATDRRTYVRAGELGFGLRRRGVAVLVTDYIIAAIAERLDECVLTLDSHFEELAREASLKLDAD